MLKKVAVGLLVLAILVLAILGCLTYAKKLNAFYLYILCFLTLVAAVLFVLLVLVMNIIWKLLPGDLKKAYEGKRTRFDAILFFSALAFYIIAGVIDLFCLPGATGFISLLGSAATFVFAVFLAWSLIKPGRPKTLVAGAAAFILFIALLSFANSTALKSGKIANADLIDTLNTLPYVAWIPAEKNMEKRGVIQYDPKLAFDGLNLYSSYASQEAYLIDMHGNIVHKWAKKLKGVDYWFHAEMCSNRDLLVLIPGRMLVRLDGNSQIKWKKEMDVHHDVCVDENKKICVLAQGHKVVFWHAIPVPIACNSIVRLSPNGRIEKKIYVYDLVKEHISGDRIIKIYGEFLRILKPENVLRILMLRFAECKQDIGDHHDILHTNSIEIMDRNVEGFCRKGDWLISIRQLDLVGIVDAEKEQLAWSWGPGQLSWQHHPTLLENGNVLIFDNGVAKGFSRIVELNPLTKKIVWEYKSKPPEKFFSSTKGASQRLPNGNTLITESAKGRVFEVTKEGKVVWEFYTPDVRTEDKKRAAIYRMTRIGPERYKLAL